MTERVRTKFFGDSCVNEGSLKYSLNSAPANWFRCSAIIGDEECIGFDWPSIDPLYKILLQYVIGRRIPKYASLPDRLFRFMTAE